MGHLRRTLGIVIPLFVCAAALPAPASATGAYDASDVDCVVIVRAHHKGDELYADLYISTLTYEDGKFYVNGQSYPKAVLKLVDQIEAFVNDNTNGNQPDDPPDDPVEPYKKYLNPVTHQIVGPLMRFLDKYDPDKLPIIQFELRVPVPENDKPGVRLAVVVNTPVCAEELA